jgi:hypothetical protein
MASLPADTIPRTHRIVEHSRDQLLGIASGEATFEDCRLRYGRTQERLARERKGRVTAARVAETDRNWASTADVLSEMMRWGAVERKPLPSARRFVDAHREELFELTSEIGQTLVAAASTSASEYVDSVTEVLIVAHPHLQRLLDALDAGPIIWPVVSQGDIHRGREAQLGTVGWANWAAEMIGGGIEPSGVEKIVTSHLTRRFGKRPPESPSDRALVEAMNDAMAVAGFTARGLPLDATTLKTLIRWGSELLLVDQTRYAPAYAQRNVVWLAADLESSVDGQARPVRRGLRRHGKEVAAALVDSYFAQAAAADSSLQEPYLPVHTVRAQAALETKVMRALGDRVLTELVDGGYSELNVLVFAHIGTRAALPSSEPPFRYEGRRRLELTMSRTHKKRRHDE